MQHLSTRVHAELRPGVTDLDLVRALHPTPAVAGAPYAEAVAALRDRGVEVLGDPMDLNGPEKGDGARYIFFRAPWGLFLELISYPNGRAHEGTDGPQLFDPRG